MLRRIRLCAKEIICHLKVCRQVYKHEIAMRYENERYTKSSQRCRGYALSSRSPLRSAPTLQLQTMPMPKGTLPGAHASPDSKHSQPFPFSTAILPCPWTTTDTESGANLNSQMLKVPLTRRRRKDLLYSTLVDRGYGRELIWCRGLSYCKRGTAPFS